MSPVVGLLTPKRNRQKSGVPSTAFVERSPLCPPSPPDHLRLTVPIGSSISSCTTSTSDAGILKNWHTSPIASPLRFMYVIGLMKYSFFGASFGTDRKSVV